ncbi:hypothetical protein L3X38_032235 [Prunus dulcis]|uniref:Uncharacterized protein n=1 Tax=Prunus dulcis TaxID=3755 RepID=A0AAD4VE06_PRUDU|nr:hypothetical protein L3X38_032235 [Prunus dulcis]
MKSILLLSFNDLPYRLKQCFLYCSLFPEDEERYRECQKACKMHDLMREIAMSTAEKKSFVSFLMGVKQWKKLGPSVCQFKQLMEKLDHAKIWRVSQLIVCQMN